MAIVIIANLVLIILYIFCIVFLVFMTTGYKGFNIWIIEKWGEFSGWISITYDKIAHFFDVILHHNFRNDPN